MKSKRPLRILLVDDEKIIHQTIGEGGGYLGFAGHRVDSAYDIAAGTRCIQSHDYDLALVDLKMSDGDGLTLLHRIKELRPMTPVVIITGHGSMETVIEALRLGASDFLPKPIKLHELDAVIEKSLQIRKLRLKTKTLRETIGVIQAPYSARSEAQRFVGISQAADRVRDQIREAVESRCDTILITGETGTGKEVVAREIHFQGGGYESPFIAVPCPALPDSLIESELFGHIKGAFTGATEDRAGCFELADGGTLFLDEIADLSQAAQAALLRVLETRAFRRVGGSEEITVGIRLIGGSNAPLETLVEAGQFRRDLFYRLNVYAIHLVPLRERRQDILPLADHFLDLWSSSRGQKFDGFSPEAVEYLINYDFPGNARELRNIVERAAILGKSGRILADHLRLPTPFRGAPAPGPAAPASEDERRQILKALDKTKWNRRQAGKDLGMPYSTLRYKMKILGIE